MRVMVLGGDGFCGWPTALYLSDRGHDITILDNLSRRKIDVDLEVDSLTPIVPIGLIGVRDSASSSTSALRRAKLSTIATS